MSCLLSENAERFNLRLKEELAQLGWLGWPTRSYYFARELNDEESPPTVPPRRPADLPVQVYLELLTENVAAGREAEEMLKTGFQCVSISVTPGLVRSGPPSPMMLTRRV